MARELCSFCLVLIWISEHYKGSFNVLLKSLVVGNYLQQ
jgi:hypothetical protein